MAGPQLPTAEPMAVDEDDDPVVRELEVYVCNEFLGSQTQLVLFQHPLRPPWRPYDYDKVKQVRMKPSNKRMEVDLPLETRSNNYNDVIEDYKKVKAVTLRSTLVEFKTSHAIGTIKDGKLLLAPLDYAVQLRPSLTHLNVAAANKKKDDESSEEEDDEPKLHAVEVQVQKRETERQQQQRLNSYAYLSQKEEEESWVNLNLHIAESTAAESVWERFMTPKDKAIDANMDRQTYLRAVVPSGAGTSAQPSTAADDGTGPSTSAPAGSHQAGQLDAANAALPAALKALFKEHTVCSMANVRTWLDQNPQNLQAKEAAYLTDRALHEAVMAAGDIESMHRVYVLTRTGDEKLDPLRKLVIELLKGKESFKRSEFNELAKSHKLGVFTETMYNKVVKDICVSKGNTWHVKNAADGL